MDISNKNIIYTYVPPEIDWECNRDYYLIDLICMIYSVRVFKNKFKYKKIKLYTSTELKNFFDNTDYFDEVIDIEYNKTFFKNQIQGICAKHTMFKVFTAAEQTEPFIHIDADLVINDETFFSNVTKPIIFSFIENVINVDTPSIKDGYYNLYFDAFKKTIKVLDEAEWSQMGNFTPTNAANCSIFGCDDTSLCKSFKRTWEFFINNNEKLLKVKDINLALEQYYQFSFLLEDKRFYNDIHTFDDDLKTGHLLIGEYDDEIKQCKTCEDVNIDIYSKVKHQFTQSKAVHLSGMRWTMYYKILICTLLKELDSDILNKVSDSFGYFKWMDYKIN
jgi:hypothetical protein